MPYVDGDAVTVVGGNRSGAVVPSRLLGNGSLELTINDEVREADQYAWVFKISFRGVDVVGNGTSSNGSYTGTGAPIATQTTGGAERSAACSSYAVLAIGIAMLVSLL